ncbi:SDR family NAD(P)-dependent oxidoreductase (plasmid) [Paracoccus sp. TK19116]|uniref:SDR family NAD(P)-dependent oxidoreductase n=1 Tax=Paracoccus albicereus TaxID=2922394 RepID=A0ABT1MM79_9RHOB|nr:SDR family NAD(P)-dependent oxidoreductase [Paracoccus albicereus]MCQ0969382.1 SDR family NAD(P)-dependent oxidoreductase [Paracoccus albicereus]
MTESRGVSKRIWIMGASEGIGAALAHEWASQGHRLVLSARSEGPLRSLAEQIGGAEIIPADVADLSSLTTAADQIREGGELDRAVTLAALYDPGKVMAIDTETAGQIVTVNVTGTFNFARTAVPLLRKGGQLALTGSVSGYIGLPQGQIYSATKAGVINLAESLRAELAPDVDVRLISPGFVDTRLTRKNDFKMPAIIEPEEAAKAISKGLDASGFEIHFPRRLTLSLKLLRTMPYWLAMRLTRRLVT